MQQVTEPASIGASLYGALRRDIIFGRHGPGDKLKLSALRDAYGASTSTLREALNRLTMEGFVVTEGQRGFFAAPISEDDLHELAELRILLESHAMHRSFERGDTAWEGRIIAAHHRLYRMEQRINSGDMTALQHWRLFDGEFHVALIAACHSEQLLNIHRVVFDKYLRYQFRVLTNRGEIASQQHKQMLDAALARDAAAAKAILRDHIESGVTSALQVGW